MRPAKYIAALILVWLFASFTVLPGHTRHNTARPDAEGTIEIHDNQYACYNSTEYYLILVDSTLTIDNYSEHADMDDTNYNPDDLLDKKLTKDEMLRAEEFMATFPWDSVQDKYVSGIKKECDSVRQMDVEVRYNGLSKSIDIKDCYSAKMARVFQFINSLIPEEKRDSLQIDYTPKEFKCHKKD